MMRKPILTIFYQYNPWNATIGGIQSLINTFIKYAPTSFELRLVGTGDNAFDKLGHWQQLELCGRPISFFPLFRLHNDDVRGLIPTTVKYTASLLQHQLSSDFMHFHRIEPALASFRWAGDKTLFIHNDIHQQMMVAKGTNSILWQRFPAAYFLLEKLLVKQFDHILSCNAESTQFYKQRYPKISGQIDNVKNTVDPDIFYPLDSKNKQQVKQKIVNQLGLQTSTKIILFAGRLHPQKNPLLLIRAIAALENPSIHLLIAGDGELKAELIKEIHQTKLDKQITLLGPVDQAQLAELHQISDVFALSSLYEGLPLVVLEALACGTPIVTTRCGQTPKVLTPNSGIVVDDQNPKTFAQALHQVLEHPQRYNQPRCIEAVAPYSAPQVVGNIFDDMLARWQPIPL